MWYSGMMQVRLRVRFASFLPHTPNRLPAPKVRVDAAGFAFRDTSHTCCLVSFTPGFRSLSEKRFFLCGSLRNLCASVVKLPRKITHRDRRDYAENHRVQLRKRWRIILQNEKRI